MLFEWDEAKNRINREKHGLGFDAAFAFDWENALIADRTRPRDGVLGEEYGAICRFTPNCRVLTAHSDARTRQF